MPGPNGDELIAQYLQMQQVLTGKQVVFVVGCPNSGTDWLGALLGTQPDLVVGGEGHFGDRLVPEVERALELYNAAVTGSGDPENPRVAQVADRLLVHRQLCDAALFRYVAAAPRGHEAVAVVDHTAEHSQVLPLLYTLYPQAKVVHVLRDPRDAAVSAYVHAQARGRSEELLRFSERFLRMTWPRHVLEARQTGAAVGMGQYQEVRYEDLVLHPRTSFAAVLRFLGLNASEERVDEALRAADGAHDGEQPGCPGTTEAR